MIWKQRCRVSSYDRYDRYTFTSVEDERKKQKKNPGAGDGTKGSAHGRDEQRTRRSVIGWGPNT